MPLSLEELTNVFKALSDATRLRVVNLLRTQSLCVGDLQAALGLSQPVISKHLAVLRGADLVRADRQGHKICYSLARAPFLNYPLSKFLAEVSPFSRVLATDAQKLSDFKGDGASCPPCDEERARSGPV